MDDHRAISQSVKDGDAEEAVKHGMIHLSRLDSTIEAIYENHANYFEPEVP